MWCPWLIKVIPNITWHWEIQFSCNTARGVFPVRMIQSRCGIYEDRYINNSSCDFIWRSFLELWAMVMLYSNTSPSQSKVLYLLSVFESVALFALRWQPLLCESKVRQTLCVIWTMLLSMGVPVQIGISINVCSHCSQSSPNYLFLPNMTAVVKWVWKAKGCTESQIFNLQSGPQRRVVYNVTLWKTRHNMNRLIGRLHLPKYQSKHT